jgi:DNA-binding beta-propeller fold protein YncE
MRLSVVPQTAKKGVVFVCVAAALAALSGSALYLRADTQPPVRLPGSQADGSILLANGWRLAPAGRMLTTGDLPLNFAQSPDGRYLVVMSNGLSKPSFSIIDVASWTVKSTVPLDHTWLGLAWHPTQPRFYMSGGAQGNVQEIGFVDGVLTRLRTFVLPGGGPNAFVGGLVVSRDGRTLYATNLFLQTLSVVDLGSGQVVNTIPLPAEPYTVLPSADGSNIFVSLWGGQRVQVYAAATMTLVTELGTNQRPNAMALSADGTRLFVACAGDSSVWAFDTLSWLPIEQISTSMYPLAPKTATPNALSVSPDGSTLLAANADNNAVAVIDISNPTRGRVSGFIPTSWYPTGVQFSRDGRQIFVLNGKGLVPVADRLNNGAVNRLQGSVAVLPVPDRTTLAAYTRTVYSVTPYTDKARLKPVNAPLGSPIPAVVGGSTPIRHVIYVIRENRTYDQILGDMKQGNGDPTLTMFGSDVTPNAHALSQNFVLFDNFFVDAEVSYDGHAFATSAFANDFVQKMWQTYYGSRGGQYLSEGGGLLRSPFGNIAAPTDGYLWDFARRASVTFRSYGEFVDSMPGSTRDNVIEGASVPGLRDAVATKFAGFDLLTTDRSRFAVWQSEFQTYVTNGNLPQLSIVHLGNDHTAGTSPGYPTPRAMVGENDFALGRLIDTVSNSIYWKDTAILAVEDDAQSGPDHVDSHRSVLLVASPYAKRGVVDHTLYTTSGVLRTIELLLGIQPMSQYDASATPLYSAFQPNANLQPYSAVTPAIPLDEKNLPTAVGAAVSATMNFSIEDMAPEDRLNRVLWDATKGNQPMPPPRHSIFMNRDTSTSQDDDDR